MKAGNRCRSMTVFLMIHSYIIGYSQSVNRIDSVCWSSDYKLKWSDFKGLPPEGSDLQAVSGISISINGYRKRGLPSYEIMNLFVTQRSWTKDTSENLL